MAHVAGVQPGLALAAVATTGYLGFLVGPPLIGLAAEVAGLPAGLGIVSILCVLIAIYVTRVLPDRPFTNAQNHSRSEWVSRVRSILDVGPPGGGPCLRSHPHRRRTQGRMASGAGNTSGGTNTAR